MSAHRALEKGAGGREQEISPAQLFPSPSSFLPSPARSAPRAARIGISTSVIQRGKSGVGQHVLALVRALVASGSRHEFTLFVLEADLPLFAFARNAMRIVPVSERHRPAVRDILWHQTQLPALARAHRLDVLHVPSYRRMLWPKPCALVATIHDLAPFRVPKKYDLARMIYGRVVVRQLAHRQDHIIAVSRDTASDIARFFHVPAERVTVIHNGLAHERFSPEGGERDRATIAQRHGLHPPFFLYVARLEHPAKNHARLIAAFNRFKTTTPSPWQLVLCGSDWHGAGIIHDLVRRSPFAPDIRVTGFVADADLPAWYRAATVFVYPSLFEGFGLPPLEAMACGCPVLASSLGAVGEVCAGAAATANPLDADDLSRQLARLAGDDVLRSQLRVAGLARAQAFDWRRTAAATLDIYARAAGARHAPPVHHHRAAMGAPAQAPLVAAPIEARSIAPAPPVATQCGFGSIPTMAPAQSPLLSRESPHLPYDPPVPST